MKIDERIVGRLDQLISKGETICNTKFRPYSSGGSRLWVGDDGINDAMSSQWGMSALSLLKQIFGEESDYYQKFDAMYQRMRGNYSCTISGLGIIKAAKDDYENGYLFNTRALLQAEVFDDFLEQAEHLLANGYYQPAAVIAGSVLEDGLRKLCLRNSIPLAPKPKMDQMNADLAKSGVYNVLTQKQITALADLRNKAAHGNWSDFTKEDVSNMLRQVRSFMETYFR